MICAICKKDYKAGEDKYRPFCSRRCQLIDLGNWLGERYAVPGEAVTQEEAAAASASASAGEKRPPSGD